MIRPLARLATLLLVAGFVALGVWQVDRRAEKLALIARVERNMAAPPVAPPASGSSVGPADAYRRVAVEGRYLQDADTLVQAVTDLGGGFWVMTPVDTAAGRILVNRGFVPRDRRQDRSDPPPGVVRVSGLLRLTEPDGGFLRTNDPAGGRWYSRDVAAIAAAGGTGPLLPYFIDADAAPGLDGDWPRGGLTVVRFANNHLVYALTWFAMAGLLAWLAWRATRRRGRAG